jgi:hypothetical protein
VRDILSTEKEENKRMCKTFTQSTYIGDRVSGTVQLFTGKKETKE